MVSSTVSSEDYELREFRNSVKVEFETDEDYIDMAFFNLNKRKQTVFVPRNIGDRYIEVLDKNGFTVSYNGQF